MITALAFVILSLAVFRVVRLLIEDTILEPVRERTTFKLNPQGKLRELLECPWCIGFWISIAAAVGYYEYPTWTTWICLPFAVSAVVGLIAEHSD